MGKGWGETADIIPPPGKGPYTIVLSTPTAVQVAGITPRFTTPGSRQQQKGTLLPDPKEPLKTRFVFHEQQSQGGAAVNNSAVPDWHDDLTWTANSGSYVPVLGPTYTSFHNTSTWFLGPCLYQ